MLKLWVLKFLCFSLLLPPGDPTSKTKPTHRYRNIQAFLSFIAFGFVMYWNCKQYLQIVASNVSESQNNGPPGPENAKKPTLPPPPMSDGQFSTPPPDDTAAEDVSQFTDVFYKLMSCTLNAVLRVAIWVVYPEILRVCSRLSLIKISPLTLKWTGNEICTVVIAIASLALFQTELLVSFYFPDKKLHQVPDNSAVNVLTTILECFFGEAYALDVAAIFLVCFVTLVTKNLESATETFNRCEPPTAWSLNSNGILLNSLELPIEQTKAYQIAKLLQVEPPRKFMPNTIKRTTSSGVGSECTNGLPSIVKVNQLVCTYFEWSSLWKEAQVVTGVVTLVLFLKLTLSISFLSFLAITRIIDDRKAGAITWNTFNPIPFAIFSVMILICIGNAAFGLLRVSENLQLKILQKFWGNPSREKRMRNPTNTTCSQNEILAEKHLSMLLESLAQSPINLSALGFFTVSRSTLTNILGVIITYLVVLIQFRTSSSSATANAGDN